MQSVERRGVTERVNTLKSGHGKVETQKVARKKKVRDAKHKRLYRRRNHTATALAAKQRRRTKTTARKNDGAPKKKAAQKTKRDGARVRPAQTFSRMLRALL
jgi:hypothetical protein